MFWFCETHPRCPCGRAALKSCGEGLTDPAINDLLETIARGPAPPVDPEPPSGDNISPELDLGGFRMRTPPPPVALVIQDVSEQPPKSPNPYRHLRRVLVIFNDPLKKWLVLGWERGEYEPQIIESFDTKREADQLSRGIRKHNPRVKKERCMV